MYDYKVFLTEHCKNGHDFEVVVLKLLTGLGFEARLTSGDDNGVDIIASITLGGYFKKYYIQCKFHNKTIGKAAVQEVYTGTQYFCGDGQPVVIAANKMSLEAKTYAKKLGVEVLTDLELTEVVTSIRKRVDFGNKRKGLFGVMLAIVHEDTERLKIAFSKYENSPENDEKEVTADNLEQELISTFDEAEILVTDSHKSYISFAEEEAIQLEQIESEKHAKGPFNLARINSLHSEIAKYWPKQQERIPSTKYMDLSLILFWWLQKNKDKSLDNKVSLIYDMLSKRRADVDTEYDKIKDRELDINTKGYFPRKV